MSENNASQQQMLEKIQLLKQKYLKKSPTVQKYETYNKDMEQNKSLRDNSSKKQEQFNQQIPINKQQAINQKQNIIRVENTNVKKQTQKILQKNQNKKQQAFINQNENIVKDNDNNNQSQDSKDVIKNIFKFQLGKIKQPLKNKRQFYQRYQPSYYKDPFRIWQNTALLRDSTQNYCENDPQYINIQYDQNDQIKKSANIPQNPPDYHIDMKQLCEKWIVHPKKALYYMLFRDELYYCEQNFQQQVFINLPLQSNNPEIPILMKQVINNFVFNTQKLLNKYQKQTLYNIVIQYFTPSFRKLSDILLISLVKLGKQFTSIYAQQILDKIDAYLKVIIRYKKLFMKQQYEQFMECLLNQLSQTIRHNLDHQQLYVKKALWLLFVKPQSIFLHQYFLPQNLNQYDLFGVFCAIHPEDQGNSLSLLYLKCLDSLTPIFCEQKILQKVIETVNKIKVPEPLYKPTKQLKLKMIKAADLSNKNKTLMGKNNDEDKGFMSFLNQKIGKLKQKTQKQFNQKDQKRRDIFYDQSKRKYMQINSQVK